MLKIHPEKALEIAYLAQENRSLIRKEKELLL